MKLIQKFPHALFCCFVIAIFLVFPTQDIDAQDQPTAENVMLVLDVSGSMWGQIEGQAKITIARNAVKAMLEEWSGERQLGLIAYGHRKRGDCGDIEVVLPVDTLDSAQFSKIIAGLTPRGMTPLSASVKLAAEELKYSEQKATVILISDGIENCDLDPCELGKQLESSGIDFTTHVIGFDITEEDDQAKLRCLADNTGGVFVAADNAEELSGALAQTAQVKVPVATPEPEPVVMPDAEITAPESAIKGTEITVELDAPDGLEGYLYLYPAGRDKSISYTRVWEADLGGYKPATIRMPAELGDYLIRWEGKRREHLAETTLSVVDAEIQISVPEQAPLSTEISVEFEAPEGLGGYVYLYPAGRDKSVQYSKVREAKMGGYQPSSLRLPAQTGEYLVRWESSKRENLAEARLQVIEAEVEITAPEKAVMGTEISVDIGAPEKMDGYIYLYPEGRDKSISYSKVREAPAGGYKPTKVRLPAVAGSFLLRWENSKRDHLAETKIEVEQAEVTLTHPEEAPIGTEIEVALSAPDGLTGYVYLYAAGRDKSLTYAPVREGQMGGYKPVRLRLPVMPGEYELQWQSSDKRVLAESKFEVKEAKVEIFAAESAEAGSTMQVRVEAPAGLDGYLYLHKKGNEKQISYHRVYEGRLSDYKPISINLPDQAGEYELKWLTQRKEFLGETSFTITEKAQ